MVGRRVKHWYWKTGEVVLWKPLGAGVCDTLVLLDDGREVWFASHDLEPIDGLGPLPSRGAARERARAEALCSLRAVRGELVAEWLAPWPGCEHGKAVVGRAIDAAISELESEACDE